MKCFHFDDLVKNCVLCVTSFGKWSIKKRRSGRMLWQCGDKSFKNMSATVVSRHPWRRIRITDMLIASHQTYWMVVVSIKRTVWTKIIKKNSKIFHRINNEYYFVYICMCIFCIFQKSFYELLFSCVLYRKVNILYIQCVKIFLKM